MHYYPNMAVDPWLYTYYNTNALGSATIDFSVPSFSVDKTNPVAARALVLHLSTSTRVACGIVGTAERAAASLSKISGYTGTSTAVGTIVAQSLPIGIEMIGTLTGLPALALFEVAIYDGFSCSSVGSELVSITTRLASSSGSAQVSESIEDSSLSLAYVAGRVVVVSDALGIAAACGILASTAGEVVSLAAYPSYLGDYVNATGTLVVAQTNDALSITGNLANVAPSCTSCSLRVVEVATKATPLDYLDLLRSMDLSSTFKSSVKKIDFINSSSTRF